MRRAVVVIGVIGCVVACSSTGLVIDDLDGGSGADGSSSGSDATISPADATTTADVGTSTDATTSADSAGGVDSAAADAAADAAEDSATDAASDASTDASDGGACRYVPEPVRADCPAECTGGCAGGTCHVDCTGTSPATTCGDHNWVDTGQPGIHFFGYVGPAVRCPDGMPCKIHCGGQGCVGKQTYDPNVGKPYTLREPQAVFRCPQDASCTVEGPGVGFLNIQCGDDHPCTLDCKDDPIAGTYGCGLYLYVHCGTGRCQIIGGIQTPGNIKIGCHEFWKNRGPACECIVDRYVGLANGGAGPCQTGVGDIPCTSGCQEAPCPVRWTAWP